MRPRAVLAAALALVPLRSAAQAPPPRPTPRPPTFEVGIEVINLNVSVTDPRNRYVTDLLEKAQFTMDEPKKRRFRVFRLLLAAGAIYAVGTRTGAFQRVKGWMNEMRGQMDQMAARTTEKATEAGYRLGDVVEHTGRTIQKTGQRVEQAGDQMEQKAKQTGTTA